MGNPKNTRQPSEDIALLAQLVDPQHSRSDSSYLFRFNFRNANAKACSEGLGWRVIYEAESGEVEAQDSELTAIFLCIHYTVRLSAARLSAHVEAHVEAQHPLCHNGSLLG